jgi:zinc transport system permease protein
MNAKGFLKMVIINILDLLSYRFFQNALLGGIVAAVTCASIGLFLILKKEAMIGDGIAHTAFGGIALGLLVGINPLLTALGVSVLSVFGISYMRRKGMAPSDSAIAVMLALGFSFGLIVISVVRGFNVSLFTYLFGSILTIGEADLLIVSLLGIFVLLFLGFFRRELLCMVFDEEDSRVMGVPTNALSIVFDLLVATTIVLSIKVIGIVLVVALLVLPGLSALQLSLSFRKTILVAIVFSIISTVTGILFSAAFDVATSGLIVFASVLIFLLSVAYKKLE